MGAPAASRLLLLVGGGFPCADRPRALRVAAAAIELPSCMPSPSSCIVVTSLNRVGWDLARRASEAATSGSDNSSAAEGREGSMPGGVITHRGEEEATQVRAAECRGGGRTHLARPSCIHKYRYLLRLPKLLHICVVPHTPDRGVRSWSWSVPPDWTSCHQNFLSGGAAPLSEGEGNSMGRNEYVSRMPKCEMAWSASSRKSPLVSAGGWRILEPCFKIGDRGASLRGLTHSALCMNCAAGGFHDCEITARLGPPRHTFGCMSELARLRLAAPFRYGIRELQCASGGRNEKGKFGSSHDGEKKE